ncbi:class I SAM-dependent methyltransferase [Patescibacteria group bacterium]|nr:class I SAM-dependent methyltransferase [Patescibacteria group bacterium]
MDTSIYDDINYFLGHPEWGGQNAWDACMIRFGDMLAAMAYALGIPSWNAFRDIIYFVDDFGMELIPHIYAVEQLRILWEARKRTPKMVVDIGSGRGEIPIGFTHLGIPTIGIEPSKSAMKMFQLTKEKLSMPDAKVHLINTGILEATEILDFSNVDTVILCESIEHIDAKDFTQAYHKIIRGLRKANGMMIITNWINMWPIEWVPPYHCRGANDFLYDKLARDARKVIFRQGSHLVMRYY